MTSVPTQRLSGLSFAIAAGLAMTACAVPQPALDQANESAHLMMQMQDQLDNLAKTQQAIANQRVAEIKKQRTLVLQYNIDSTDDSRLMAAAGMTDRSKLYDVLTALADARSQENKSLDTEQTALDAQLASLLTAVPTTTKATAAAEKDMAALGLQRSSKERLDFVKTYGQTVRSDVKAAQAAAASAAASASTAASAVKLPAGPAQHAAAAVAASAAAATVVKPVILPAT